MSGLLFFDNLRPVVGAKLIIIVDSVNKPTGMWDGELITIGINDPAALYEHACYLPDAWWTFCNAHITDPQAPREFIGHEPTINYSAFLATSGSQYLRQRLHDANTEIRGLKRRMEIERSVLHGMIKAIFDPNSFSRLEKLLEEFITRLNC